ncbi:hypothetical protein P153DRAFT_383422 [Dothidotthia symphoricarpi CBS 119687]|uniref:Uncharacterized protein n=1 Tax=Dothidotthia symphoricarpi CBS 119687 TaxID=1392245 RepID=A0A6A6AH86_9PLEO|nr:uncharacterized protein P153DRAFT_383422 [Dothidotthia symphoricarpi CBS 119687]KAF2131309.1 hypothetical protein P153DRAFT_383422 [Dothidotthia symphoricarpi CBS 119687]
MNNASIPHLSSGSQDEGDQSKCIANRFWRQVNYGKYINVFESQNDRGEYTRRSNGMSKGLKFRGLLQTLKCFTGSSPHFPMRVAGLGFLFPGAGFVVVCTIPSILALVVTLLAVAIYQSNTRDDRYTKETLMEFVVTENAWYVYDIHRIADAVFTTWTTNLHALPISSGF